MATDRAGEVVLSYAGIVLAPGRPELDGAIRAGEVVGLAGLEGQGQERFIRTLAGVERARPGRIWIGEPGSTPLGNARQAAREGVAYLPGDRRATGIFPSMSILDNFGLPSMSAFSTCGVLHRKRQREAFAEQAGFLSIAYPDEHAAITTLSGGNQQKVLLARWLAMKPRVLLLNDPTRGVDLGTRLGFYDAFRELTRKGGTALVILSSEIDEIVEVCNRVLVFRDHAIGRTMERGTMTVDAVLAAMFGREEPRR